MKTSLKAILSTAAAVLALGACAAKAEAKLPPMDEELAASIDAQIEIVGAEAIYGNIYLPEEIDGVEITWKSSNPDVIVPTQLYEKAPGVVNRPKVDTNVTLTAIATKDGTEARFEREVTVKGLDHVIEDEEYVGYYFGHFISENGKTEGGNKIAVGEQMYFAFADEGKGLHFKDL